jgi:hypothetical protein
LHKNEFTVKDGVHKMSPETDAKSEAFAYGSILQTLTEGLYPNKKHVIRELVQNAYDGLGALRTKVPEEPIKPISIKINDSSIFVADYGFGMNEQKMREYRYLGFSEKIVGEDAGFRGIGKYSPVSLCERIIVDSSQFGIDKHYRVVIDASEMRKRNKNTPLDEVLKDHTSIADSPATKEEHYTFVELQGIKQDAKSHLDLSELIRYLRQTAPLPLDPQFTHAEVIEKGMVKFVPGYFPAQLTVNGVPIYKTFIEPCAPPVDQIIWDKERENPIAYYWACPNKEEGRFKEPGLEVTRRHHHAGLIFKIKNITVGDHFLPRKAFWKTTPELSTHYFGEIHILDKGVTPSSDRTDFEDNAARRSLYEQCYIIAQDLNLRRRTESVARNFDKAVAAVNQAVTQGEGKLQQNAMPVELKDDAAYRIRRTLENLQKRLNQSKNLKKQRAAKAAMKRGERFISKLNSLGRKEGGVVDITDALKFDARCKAVYEAIINVLKKEFQHDPQRLERIVVQIHDALRASKT